MGLTVHLDHEIEQRLHEQVRASGESPDAIINRALLGVLDAGKGNAAKGNAPTPRAPFVVKPIKGFELPAQWTSGCVQDLLDILEGPEAR